MHVARYELVTHDNRLGFQAELWKDLGLLDIRKHDTPWQLNEENGFT